MRLTRVPATEPFFGRLAQYRFDDPRKKFGVCYLADSLDVAFAETIRHGNCVTLPDDSARIVSLADVTAREVVRFTGCRNGLTLHVANLTGAALQRLRGNNDLSAGHDYRKSRKWAAWLHERFPEADGIQYVSRQCNTGLCYALFDRSELHGGHSREMTDEEVDTMCDRFGLEVLS